MSKSILYTRVSTLDQRTDRQRVTENDFSLVVEDYCSGSIPIFERPEGSKLKKMIDRNLVSSISVWQIDRCGRDSKLVSSHSLMTVLEKHYINPLVLNMDQERLLGIKVLG